MFVHSVCECVFPTCLCVALAVTLGGLPSGHKIASHSKWSLSNSIFLMMSPLIHAAIFRRLWLLVSRLGSCLRLYKVPLAEVECGLVRSGSGFMMMKMPGRIKGCNLGFGFRMSPAGLVCGSTLNNWLMFIFIFMLKQQQDNGCPVIQIR